MLIAFTFAEVLALLTILILLFDTDHLTDLAPLILIVAVFPIVIFLLVALSFTLALAKSLGNAAKAIATTSTNDIKLFFFIKLLPLIACMTFLMPCSYYLLSKVYYL